MKIKIAYPTTTADAVRCVAYLRAWSVSRLAREIGADPAHLNKIIHLKDTGTDAMTARVMAHMPENVVVVKR